MSEPDPFFFFCYSRADITDREPYVERFFEDLRSRVAVLAEMGINKDDPERKKKLNRAGFRDEKGVQIGQDWKTEIGKAIQHNAVLICLYSPNFFSRLETKQFCGKEFTAFLLRNRDVRYVTGTGRPHEEMQLREARNIIPILWENPAIMKARTPSLPPYVLHAIQWAPNLEHEPPDLIAQYQTLGLRQICLRYRLKYRMIVDHIAATIVELAKHPLPPLPGVPEIENLRNAFWQPPHDAPLGVAAVQTSPEQVLADVSWGPEQMLIIEVRHGGGIEPWFPYAGQESIAAAVERLANRKRLAPRWLSLDPRAAGFIDGASVAIRDAADHSGRSLLLLDPRSLSDEPSRAAVLGLLKRKPKRPCRAGLLVLGDAGDQEAKSLIESYKGQLESADPSGNWVVRTDAGTMADFNIAADSVADDLLARIVVTDPVRQTPPDNAGPTVRPRMTNRLDDRQAA